jgi:hypothetical protein
MAPLTIALEVKHRVVCKECASRGAASLDIEKAKFLWNQRVDVKEQIAPAHEPLNRCPLELSQTYPPYSPIPDSLRYERCPGIGSKIKECRHYPSKEVCWGIWREELREERQAPNIPGLESGKGCNSCPKAKRDEDARTLWFCSHPKGAGNYRTLGITLPKYRPGWCPLNESTLEPIGGELG